MHRGGASSEKGGSLQRRHTEKKRGSFENEITQKEEFRAQDKLQEGRNFGKRKFSGAPIDAEIEGNDEDSNR